MPKLGIGFKNSKFWHRIIGDKAAKKCYGKMMSISSLPQNINMERIITIQLHTLNYHICHFLNEKINLEDCICQILSHRYFRHYIACYFQVDAIRLGCIFFQIDSIT